MVDLGEVKKPSHVSERGLSFAEIVGQRELKRALLTVAANEGLDGLLIQGEKGTAKSTAVRALTDLLPEQIVIEDCPYGCHPNDPERQCADCRDRTDPPTAERTVPLVTLPLGATRERVVGTLSVADALAGDYDFDPGLLARANRGFLYVDEVNLLDDHLVDVLLDAAASGVNRVERDGVSVSHPAQFTLVGTMNPEEGDLRPQLRDRFALQATVTSCADIDDRVSIISRAIGREGEETSVTSGPEQVEEYRRQLQEGRDRLADVELPTTLAREIAELCRESGADGHRGDIATARTAMTFAALDGRTNVTESDVREAAELALPHRLRSRPFEDEPDPDELIDDHFDDEGGEDGDEDGTEGADGGPDGESDSPAEADGESGGEREDGENDSPTHESTETDSESDEPNPEPAPSPSEGRTSQEGTEPEPRDGGRESNEDDEGTEGNPVIPGQSRTAVGTGRAPEVTAPEAVEDGGSGGGRRSKTRPHVDNEGARVRSRRAESSTRIDAAASVRAARSRGASSIESRDLRQSVRTGDASSLVLFVVDASASMLPAMRTAKGTVLELLKDAYEKRDEVAFVAFAGDEAEVLLPPTNSVTLAARHLKELPTGDRTPLPSGIRTACEVLEQADPTASVVVLVTDGRANVADGSPVRETRETARRLAEYDPRVVVVDAGDDDRSGLTDVIAEATDGERVPLSELSAERIEATVGGVRES